MHFFEDVEPTEISPAFNSPDTCTTGGNRPIHKRRVRQGEKRNKERQGT